MSPDLISRPAEADSRLEVMTTMEHSESAVAMIDPAAIEAYTGLVAGHATMAVNAALVTLGDQLGLWKAMAGAGPLTVSALADKAGVTDRYLREWLSAMAASRFLGYEPTTDTFELSDAGAAVLADEGSPDLFIGPFQFMPLIAEMLPALRAGFRSGVGFSWLDRDAEFCDAEERFTRPLHRGLLVGVWLASVPGLIDRLSVGARVADVGCGYGRSTIEMANAFPASTFVGFDFHDHSIARAREAARAEGVTDRVTFEVADARSFPGAGYDLVLFCDSLHDMGDPVAAARHARERLAPGGRLVTLDPKAAGDSLAENLADPFAPMLYAVSCFICTPSAISQDGPEVLGALGGEAAFRRILTEAGFTTIERHGHDAPLNMVMAATKDGDA
jgi:ubiquinone/menaquinone biosynthesis C-methylase UbiE